MKFILTPDEHKALPEATQTEYTETNGAFTLTLEGHEEHLVPKAKKDLAEQHRKAAEAKVTEGEAREAKLLSDLEGAKGGSKELEQIRTNAQAEIEKVRAEYAERDVAQKAEVNKGLIAVEAEKFAQEHFTVPSLIKGVYANRLTVVDVNGTPVIRTLDAEGKESVLSIGDMQKEFLANKEFSTIIKATQGSGGSAEKNEQGGSGSASSKKTDFSMNNLAGATAAVKAKLEAQGVEVG